GTIQGIHGVRVLLDAHALIWAVDEPSKLGSQASIALQDRANELVVSAGTIWEVSIKVGLDKLTLSMTFGQWMNTAIADLGAAILPITTEHADTQARLTGRGDPFDRLLAAQSIFENLAVVSNDAQLDQYGINRLW
ncbi:MAG: type II toxin-antitoxin system VapC family toxin, partial [Phycisphaerales bacterium]|nr:type II toxin-antitoxin system VapC family toxin [Phycisphaerales bacterium]